MKRCKEQSWAIRIGLDNKCMPYFALNESGKGIALFDSRADAIAYSKTFICGSKRHRKVVLVTISDNPGAK